MVNTFLFNHKSLGSAALRCGSSSFGIKSMGKFASYPSLFVAVFKCRQKQSKFLSFLRSKNLTYQTDFYYRYAIHKEQFVYMVFVRFYLVIPSHKMGFRNFRELCSSRFVKVYSNSCYNHPHSFLSNNLNNNFLTHS